MTVRELMEKLMVLPADAVVRAGETAGGAGEIWADDGSRYFHIWMEGPDEP